MPRSHLEAIGLEPRGRRVCELADGGELVLDVTVGELEFMDEIVGGTIIMGSDEAEPLLGVTALDSAGIEVDPVNQRLKRLPRVRLKRLAKPLSLLQRGPGAGPTAPIQRNTARTASEANSRGYLLARSIPQAVASRLASPWKSR